MTSKLRERFEAIRYGNYALRPNKPDEYIDPSVQYAWEAYKAALEPVMKLLKQWQSGDGFNGEDWYGLSKCRDELAKLLEE